jgi:hypothetical protein
MRPADRNQNTTKRAKPWLDGWRTALSSERRPPCLHSRSNGAATARVTRIKAQRRGAQFRQHAAASFAAEFGGARL